MKRWCRVYVSEEILRSILTIGWRGEGVTCIEGLPEGARFVSMSFEPGVQSFSLIYEHSSFEMTSGNEILPVLKPRFSYESS